MMQVLKSCLILGTALAVQSCFFVAGAAAGAAAVSIVYDHRSIDNIMLDQKIANQISKKLHTEPATRHNTNINVSSFGQQVLITGQVPNNYSRNKAKYIAQSIPQVKTVYNGLTIGKPVTNLVHASDSWLTTKIKTTLLAQPGLAASSIKVVTEDSMVYLLGAIEENKLSNLISTIKNIAGVKQVIPILSTTNTIVGNTTNVKQNTETKPVVEEQAMIRTLNQ